MNHLDEGTIHAWLDGALDAEQASAAEAHIHACPQCAEAVAEARGLMAASSRILGALDDVPAGVIPAAPVKRARPMWRAAPWVTGIAAVLVGAVILNTDTAPRRAELASTPPAAVGDTMSSAVAPAPATDAPNLTAPVVATRPQVAQAPANAPAAPRAAAARRPAVGEVAGVAGGASVGASPVTPAPTEVAAMTGSDVPRFAEESRKAQVAADASVSRERTIAEAERGRSAERAQAMAPAPAPPPTSGMVPQRSIVTDLRVLRPVDPLRDTIAPHARIAGCYVVAIGPRGNFVQELSRRGAAADARRQAPVAAAAPTAEGTANRVTVRLDSTLERQGYRVRDARADTAIGWWSPVHADSASVEIQMLGVAVVLAGQDRIACPQP